MRRCTLTKFIVCGRNDNVRVSAVVQVHRRTIVVDDVDITLLTGEQVYRLLHRRVRFLVGTLTRCVVAVCGGNVVRSCLDQEGRSAVNRLVRVQVNLPGVGNTGVLTMCLRICITDKHVIPVVTIPSQPTRIRRGQAEGRIVGNQVEGLLRGSVNHVEARRRLIADRVIVAVDHAVRTATHPETTGRVGRVVEVVVDDNTSAVRSRRNFLAVLNAEVGVRENITVVRQARLDGLVAGQSRIIVSRRRRRRRVVRLDNPGHITCVTICRLNACAAVVRLSCIQAANIETPGGASTTLVSRTL